MRSDLFWIRRPGSNGGGLAVSARPRGGDWLEDEVRAWRDVGVDHVASLLTPDEAIELDLEDEPVAVRAAGLAFTRLPVPDRGLPSNPAEFRQAVERLGAELDVGATILVHCRQGIGRATLLAAGVLARTGQDIAAALAAIQAARGRPVPDTEEQRDWLLQTFGPRPRVA